MQRYVRDLCSNVFGLDDAVIFDVIDLKRFLKYSVDWMEMMQFLCLRDSVSLRKY